MGKKNWLYAGFVALILASNICAAQGSLIDAKRDDMAAKKAEAIGNSFAGATIYAAGTRFTITQIHPNSAWYSSFNSIFSGKNATAVDCSDGFAHGIEEETGSRAGYYSGCFYLDGNSFEYYVYGFKFRLIAPTLAPICISPQILQNGQCVTPTPTCYSPQILQNGQCVTPTPTCTSPQVLQNGQCVTPTTTTSGATYSNGVLTIKRMEVDSGALGKTYYDVTMTLKALSNPLTFVVDSAVPAK